MPFCTTRSRRKETALTQRRKAAKERNVGSRLPIDAAGGTPVFVSLRDSLRRYDVGGFWNTDLHKFSLMNCRRSRRQDAVALHCGLHCADRSAIASFHHPDRSLILLETAPHPLLTSIAYRPGRPDHERHSIQRLSRGHPSAGTTD